MVDCTFCKVKNGDFNTQFVYQDNDVMVFPDIHPIRPVHLLVVPKEHIKELTAVTNPELIGKLFRVASNVITENGLDTKGYRIAINGGGAQQIDHLHIHVTGPHDKP